MLSELNCINGQYFPMSNSCGQLDKLYQDSDESCFARTAMMIMRMKLTWMMLVGTMRVHDQGNVRVGRCMLPPRVVCTTSLNLKSTVP
mmetsp:Transcript_19149/g.31266  ORF Transcript_19149/g.31266 Transcript_19149/m.31266 type:complete len:88 (+) Transcript_19149:186-449(+)